MPTDKTKTAALSAALSAVFLTLCLSSAARAQTGAPPATKFDEFGDVLPTDMAARLDNFAIELQRDPNARAYMIVYRSHRDLPGVSGRIVNWMKNYLVYNRGFKAESLVAVDGGAAQCLWHELWLVPPGAAPKPRDDAYKRGFDDPDVARKYDEYGYYATVEDVPDSFSAEYMGGLAGFAEALRKEPRALAYVIAYEGYRVDSWDEPDGSGRRRTRRRVHADPRGSGLKELRKNRALLATRHGIPASRVRLVQGGYRKWRGLEFWIVPPGARPPVPTPNLYPPTRK